MDGIIQKQGIVNLLITYAGFVFGFFNVIVLYPILFSKEQFGLTRLYNDLGNTFAVIASMGLISVIPRFLPQYTKEKNKDLMPLSLLLSIAGALLLTIVIFIFKNQIFDNYCSENVLFRQYAYLVIFMGICNVLFSILSIYSNSSFNTNIVFLISQLFNRAFPTLLLICVYFKLFGFKVFIHLFAFSSLLQLLILLMHLKHKGLLAFDYRISMTTRLLKKAMFVFGASIFVMIVIESLSTNIQVFTISDIKGLETTAIFVVASYIAQIIQIPQRSIAAIAMPIVSTAWLNNDLGKIQSIYRKSSVNMNIAGLFLFLVICLNIQHLFTLIGKNYGSGINIAIFMGIAYLIDLSFGINNEIINTSKYWKLNFITHFLLLLLMIPANYFFIRRFGGIGAAYALIISLSIYNSIRMLFLYVKFRMNPFTIQMLFLSVYTLIIYLGINALFSGLILENRLQIMVSISLKAMLSVILFFIPVLYFNISNEVSGIWIKIRMKLPI